ncbi:MAG: enoyl-ACP reductase [Proteobacteria bacterium]|nr:enoyl-ACP reductase [Pseudomonadota bacterium]
MGMFDGKKVLVLGVANERSIAWGIAEALHKEGAELAFNYLNEALERRVRPLADSLGCKNVLPCDVQHDDQIDLMFEELKSRWGTIDAVVHSLAYAEKEDLTNRFVNTTRKGFQTALDISAYSLVAVTKRALPLMSEKGGSILTMTYLGAERVVQNYNVMGVAKAALEASVRYLASDLGEFNIRVNAISAGPIKTLAAAGIPQFRDMLSAFAEKAPMKRNVTQADVANTGLYLLGPLGSGVTGEVVYVDCGFNIMGS